ncbi:hypothetical protein Fcan01_16847 [Folsomia candida]|uniref:Uncharacterized protein n=1 Tax=Folsomia candida TaxID=158441 RepID=A0A226DS12_FOLCA|nr:hypothetical protein Fcan01_16847 [Folsomia candida]
MILRSTLPMIKWQIKFISKLTDCPISINDNDKITVSRKFRTEKSNNFVIFRTTRLTCFSLYAIFILINGLIYLGSPNHSVGTKAVTSFGTLVLPFCYFAVILTLHKNPNDFIALFRMGLEYEKTTIATECARNIETSRILLKWIMLIFGCGSSILAPIGFMMMIVSDPKLPPYLGSVIPAWQFDGGGHATGRILLLTVNSYTECYRHDSCVQCIQIVGCVYGVTSSSARKCFHRDEIPVGILATFRNPTACKRIYRFATTQTSAFDYHSKSGSNIIVKEEIMHNVLTERVSTSTTTENQLYTSTLPTFTTLPTTKIVTTNFYLPETLHPTQPSVDHEQDNSETTTETIINTAVAEKLAIETTILPMVESTTHFSELIHRPTDPFLLLNTSITIGETNNTANWNNGSNHSGSFNSSVPTTTNLTISVFISVYMQPIPIPSKATRTNSYAILIVSLLRLFQL